MYEAILTNAGSILGVLFIGAVGLYIYRRLKATPWQEDEWSKAEKLSDDDRIMSEEELLTSLDRLYGPFEK